MARQTLSQDSSDGDSGIGNRPSDQATCVAERDIMLSQDLSQQPNQCRDYEKSQGFSDGDSWIGRRPSNQATHVAQRDRCCRRSFLIETFGLAIGHSLHSTTPCWRRRLPMQPRGCGGRQHVPQCQQMNESRIPLAFPEGVTSDSNFVCLHPSARAASGILTLLPFHFWRHWIGG